MDKAEHVGLVAVEAYDLLNRLERLLGRRLGLGSELVHAVSQLGDFLEDPETRVEAAERLMGALYPCSEPPREFWNTSTGQAVACAIGYHRAVTPYMAAAAILNVSRQRVYQLCDQGKLRRVAMYGEPEGVSPASLREHLAVYGRKR